MRIAIGVVVGYLLFAVASMFTVGAIGVREGVTVVIVSLVALALIGVIVGWVATAIAGSGARLAATILAGLIAVATLANLLFHFGAEPSWYKLGTLLLTAPAAMLMGRRRDRDRTP